MNKKPISLRAGLLTFILACCIFSILIVLGVSALLLSASVNRSSRSSFEAKAEGAIRQVELRLSGAIESSKAVSYDGEVKNAYRDYLATGDSASLYQRCTEYLSQNFSRDERVCAVYISFRDPQITACPNVISSYSQSYLTLREYLDTVQEDLFTSLGDMTTGIFFRVYNGNLYMVRNLLDLQFHSFATLAMQLNTDVIFQALMNLNPSDMTSFVLDGEEYILSPEGKVSLRGDTPLPPEDTLAFSAQPDGHSVICYASPAVPGLTGLPELGTATVITIVLILPLLFLMVHLFRRHVTRPVGTLVAATARVQGGERGYQITEVAESQEIEALYTHFNAMSRELEAQFQRIFSEQQALMQVRIKALQSQINPHFLNNTLEIINWEARLADNEKVSAMIEALSTLLEAALNRDNRNLVPLSEELSYVDAYLYIIRQRLGDKFITQREIDDSLLSLPIPRLILQPIVENAVEHDITPHRGGRLILRARKADHNLLLEVEHDGEMTPEDLETVQTLISLPPESDDASAGAVGQIGVRNVSSRLKMLYGDQGHLSITQSSDSTVLAQIVLPFALS